MRISTKKLSSLLFIIAFVAIFFSHAQAQRAVSTSSDVVVVLPFENVSNAREYNWVGTSFADGLAELLNTPGVVIISDDERELAYQKLRLPLTTLPSRATAVKLAREMRATMLVLGTYEVTPPQKGNKDEVTDATLRGTARVIRVDEGRLAGEPVDGVWSARQYDFGGPVPVLQTMQGRLAYQILYQRDQALTASLNQFIDRATKVPPRAFESYVKGVMTSNADTRSAYLQNAMIEYAKANGGATYAQAAFELGSLYFNQGDFRRAAEYFGRLQKKDANYTESAFYSALAYYRLNDFGRALGALMPLASEAPLTNIYNNAGALSLQATRKEKKKEEQTRLLTQAVMFLSRAAESAPDDPLVRFNYAAALFASGKYAEAADQIKPVINQNARDGEALFLYAKALERAGKTEEAARADNEARRFLPAYAKLQTEWQEDKTVANIPARLYVSFDRSTYLQFIKPTSQPDIANQDSANLLVKARELYTAGQDDEALNELRRALTVEPMNAEAYLMIGRINSRRGELDAAISALRTAVFWDSKLVDAHVLLGRIFYEKGDRAQALGYAKTAVGIDANNQDALGLLRQVETGMK